MRIHCCGNVFTEELRIVTIASSDSISLLLFFQSISSLSVPADQSVRFADHFTTTAWRVSRLRVDIYSLFTCLCLLNIAFNSSYLYRGAKRRLMELNGTECGQKRSQHLPVGTVGIHQALESGWPVSRPSLT
jgi:hypothetical protein